MIVCSSEVALRAFYCMDGELKLLANGPSEECAAWCSVIFVTKLGNLFFLGNCWEELDIVTSNVFISIWLVL